MNALDYIPAAVAFAAVLVALAGKPKWDPTKEGIRRLTTTGRVTLAVAVMALVASVALTLRAQQAADLQRVQRDRITRVAHTELRLAIQHLSGWFVEVLVQTAANSYAPGYQGPRTSGLAFPLCMLDKGDRELIAAATDVIARPPFSHSSGTREVIQSSSKEMSAQIDRTLQIYAAYLDSDILALLSDLRTSEFLERLHHLDMNSRLDLPVEERERHPDALGYEHVWELVGQLDRKLFRDAANPRIWGPASPIQQAVRSKDVPSSKAP